MFDDNPSKQRWFFTSDENEDTCRKNKRLQYLSNVVYQVFASVVAIETHNCLFSRFDLLSISNEYFDRDIF